MAEQVNKRIEDMINELEQMQRTELYTHEEIREIAGKRKEFEYKIQRQTKHKEDYVKYIAYELALLEDISLRRQQTNLSEKKHNIEFAIAKRLNKIFKQFIYRFQNDIEVYFQYIKFCQSVGFSQAVSGIIGQMLQIYGDKAKMWQMAAKWELEEQTNIETARNFLLKGIHRHPEADVLYIDLFKIELILAFRAEDKEIQEKFIKRADVVWRNGLKNNKNKANFLFQVCDISIQYDIAEAITKDIKEEIWSCRNEKEVWMYIASKELEDHHWEQSEDVIVDYSGLPNKLQNFKSVYEQGLVKFNDVSMCTKYIHTLLGLNENVCTSIQKIAAVKRAWLFGHEHGLLSDDMYSFGVEMLKMEGEMTKEEIAQIIVEANKKKPTSVYLWKEKLILEKEDDNKMYAVLQEASKVLNTESLIELWDLFLDHISSVDMIKSLHAKFQRCETSVILAMKPKLLEKSYELCGLKAARKLYDEFIRTPPIQLLVHTRMIEIEEKQENKSYKNMKKCYECMVQHAGADNYEIWLDYMKFELNNGNAKFVANIYSRAVGMLKKELVDKFIKEHTLSK